MVACSFLLIFFPKKKSSGSLSFVKCFAWFILATVKKAWLSGDSVDVIGYDEIGHMGCLVCPAMSKKLGENLIFAMAHSYKRVGCCNRTFLSCMMILQSATIVQRKFLSPRKPWYQIRCLCKHGRISLQTLLHTLF